MSDYLPLIYTWALIYLPALLCLAGWAYLRHLDARHDLDQVEAELDVATARLGEARARLLLCESLLEDEVSRDP